MKKILILSFLLLASYVSAVETEFALSGNYYNEFMIKPGVTLSPELVFNLNERNKIYLGFPTLTFFYFTDQTQSISIYPEVTYNFKFTDRFSAGVFGAYGVCFSQFIVPVYDRYGEEMDNEVMTQAIMRAGISTAFNIGEDDILFSIGWKGLYPYNLTIQSQPFLQLGYRKSFK